MYRFIFTLLTDPLGLPLSSIWEYVILAVISQVAYKIAWAYSSGGTFGSEIHWFVRVIAFCTIWAITYGTIWAYKWSIANWALVVCIIGAVVGVAGIIVLAHNMQNKRKVSKPKNRTTRKGCFSKQV